MLGHLPSFYAFLDQITMPLQIGPSMSHPKEDFNDLKGIARCHLNKRQFHTVRYQDRSVQRHSCGY